MHMQPQYDRDGIIIRVKKEENSVEHVELSWSATTDSVKLLMVLTSHNHR